MSDVARFTTADGGAFFIEVAGTSPGPVRRGLHPEELTEQAAGSFEALVAHLQGSVGAMVDSFRTATAGIDEVELSFSLSVRADAGIVVSKIGGDANFSVTVKWHRQDGG